MFDDLQNHTSDLAMCSIWVSVFKDQYDVSSYYSHACNTLIVPMPKRLSEITAIYTTFSGDVWLTFAVLFFATGLLLWISAMMGIVNRTVYVDLSRSLLEMMNIATSHGVDVLRAQKTSIKILLLSWIIGCLSIGISYVTIYTSRLSKPGYAKVIHTVEDFIESDMWWGSENTRAYSDIHSSLNSSSNSAHHELDRRIVAFANHNDAETGWMSGKFGMFAGISEQKYLVFYEWGDRLQFLSSYRVMKKACIFNYYTVFALQKFSPYKELFSHYALQFQEHGITQYWFMTVYRDKSGLNKFFYDHPMENNEPVALKVSSIIGALLVLFVSHILSIVIFICELTTKTIVRNTQHFVSR
ncbi:uncharacterized protein LOC119084312 [Bradysia coprophila]|uniref:uncharacterized protein LOC119084312 n=1 Tax=Bradysia coprophila TaxID=38358 RepID=UPI00187D77EE|nr:uncharacterized protein LOC119084312 [Bradysia coprophila]